MRGSFNNTCTVKFGPRSTAGAPGAVRAAGVPCRRVPQTEIFQLDFPLNLTAHWVTLDSLVLNAPQTISPWLGATFTDWEAADVVVFADRPLIPYLVCRTETVSPFVGGAYVRYLLLPLFDVAVPPWLPPVPVPPPPAPDPGPAPGASCGLAGVLAFGDIVDHVMDGVDDAWWVLPAPLGVDCVLEVFDYDVPPGIGSVIFGNVCGSLVVLADITAPGFTTIGVSSGWNVYWWTSALAGTFSFRFIPPD